MKKYRVLNSKVREFVKDTTRKMDADIERLIDCLFDNSETMKSIKSRYYNEKTKRNRDLFSRLSDLVAKANATVEKCTSSTFNLPTQV